MIGDYDEALAEIDRLKAEGVPGVMHPVDRAFYELTVAQRDKAWREIEALKAMVDAQADTIRRLRAQITQMGWEASGEGMGG